jgi:hypothetical protein
MLDQSLASNHARRTETDAASTNSEAPPAGNLSKDQVDRLAALIADGRATFPNEFLAVDRDVLQDTVRLKLKVRMVSFIAHAIALDIKRGAAEDNDEVPNND